MSRRRSDRRGRAAAAAEPDVTPIMNLTFMLILSLLTLGAVVPIGVVSVQALALGPAPEARSGSDVHKSLNLTILVTRDGFNLAASGATLDGSVDTPERPGEPLFPKVREDGRERYDFDALNRRLVEIKRSFPREQRVTITADEDVMYEDIMGTMDASRESEDGRELFPAVAFSAGVVG